jgi:hypothetical protein
MVYLHYSNYFNCIHLIIQLVRRISRDYHAKPAKKDKSWISTLDKDAQHQSSKSPLSWDGLNNMKDNLRLDWIYSTWDMPCKWVILMTNP